MKYSKIWKTKSNPKGVIQIVHGMTEYIGRYESLAQYFNGLGYIVCGYDLEGHGDNLYPGIPALYMESWECAVDNLEQHREMFKKQLTKEYGELPYCLLGFSLGSFLVRSHQMKYPNTVEKIVLVGTGMPSKSSLTLDKFLTKFRCSKNSLATPSKFVQSMLFDSYNKKIPNALSEFDWLFRSQIALEKYKQDPRVRTKVTPKFFLEFLNGMIDLSENEMSVLAQNITSPQSIKSNKELNGNTAKYEFSSLAKNTTTPDVLFLYGEEDPVSEGVDKVIDGYRKLEIAVRRIKIEGMRHDVLHDMCSEYACQVITDFLEEVKSYDSQQQ